VIFDLAKIHKTPPCLGVPIDEPGGQSTGEQAHGTDTNENGDDGRNTATECDRHFIAVSGGTNRYDGPPQAVYEVGKLGVSAELEEDDGNAGDKKENDEVHERFRVLRFAKPVAELYNATS
jgi:hypothetical protein